MSVLWNESKIILLTSILFSTILTLVNIIMSLQYFSFSFLRDMNYFYFNFLNLINVFVFYAAVAIIFKTIKDITNKINLSIDAKAEKKLVFKDLQNLVSEEIDKLPDRQQMALRLRIFEDMSFKEIAQIMDCPYDTAKANYRHALLKLKVSFQKVDWVKNLDSLDVLNNTRIKDIFSEVEQ